jgi:hypothetical protein
VRSGHGERTSVRQMSTDSGLTVPEQPGRRDWVIDAAHRSSSPRGFEKLAVEATAAGIEGHAWHGLLACAPSRQVSQHSRTILPDNVALQKRRKKASRSVALVAMQTNTLK